MESNFRPGKLRNIGYYIPRAMKFYELKNEQLTRIVFVIILFTSFLGALIPGRASNMLSAQDILINFISVIIVHLAATVYLLAYLRELKGKEYTLNECLSKILRKAVRIIGATLFYALITVLGLIFLVAPGLIVGIMFLFNIPYIIDLGDSIGDAFSASRRITRGYKWQIFSIMLVFNLLLMIPILFFITMAMSSNNLLIYYFVSAFVGSVINIMQQRLVALLYMDLEYGMTHNDQEML